MKTCIKCGEEKSLADFYANPHTGDGLLPQCKVCQRRAVKETQDLRRFNITPTERRKILAIHGNLCAMCGQPETGLWRGKPRELSIDHDHACCPGRESCGECIRGVLCSQCNLALGRIEREMDTILAGLSYLQRYETQRLAS